MIWEHKYSLTVNGRVDYGHVPLYMYTKLVGVLLSSDTDFPLCIMCLKESPGDPEHILPESIGGRLTARILCNSCNHSLGSQLVSEISSDTLVQQSLEMLKDRIPALYKQTYKKPALVGKGADGSIIRLVKKDDCQRVLSTSGAGDSIIMDTSDAVTALEKKLRRAGYDESTVERFKEYFNSLEEEVPLQLPTGATFIKRPLPELKRDIPGRPMSDRALVMIAFEFVSLICGREIYHAAFNDFRAYIQDRMLSAHVRVQRSIVNDRCDTFHIIRIFERDCQVNVEIRLFRWLVYQVTFTKFPYPGPDVAYVEDLESRKSLLAPSMRCAAEGQYLTL